MNDVGHNLRQGMTHQHVLPKICKRLFTVAGITAVAGLVAAVIGASVFTSKVVPRFVGVIGNLCFYGFLPLLVVSALCGLIGLVIMVSSMFRRKQ